MCVQIQSEKGKGGRGKRGGRMSTQTREMEKHTRAEVGPERRMNQKQKWRSTQIESVEQLYR